ncbi:MAG TPA: D-alanyl-D-alanine carboxypeptidase/D-alanyl-D-alanine-endopeptidase [Gemmatimonadaceae bacterium]|nr:D-alanyl-D-alanine carboxypeptidase/D-alanyl-D-alanine-endopeptidase [Gemmatimonadaceae bacterium]
MTHQEQLEPSPGRRTPGRAVGRGARARRALGHLLLALTAATATLPPSMAEAQARKRTARRAAPAPPPAPKATTPRSAEALRSDLAHIVGTSTRSGKWGVMVVSLTRGDTLYALNAGDAMQPASTMKLLTAAIAFERFGPEHRFETRVYHDGKLSHDGTLDGNLYMRGAGDPAFSGRFLQGGPETPVNMLAELVAGAGVKRVRGAVIGDASAFEPKTIPDGWKSTYLHLAYAAPVSALSINENVVWISVEPGAVGGAARVTFEPASSGIPLRSRVTTRAGAGSSINVVRLPDGGLEARGWVGTKSGGRRVQMVVNEPAPFTAGAFHEALVRRGIAVEGGVRMGTTPKGADELASLPSPPLAQLVSVMNRESVNHYAELLFRNAARGPDGSQVGSAETGDAALRHFFSEKLAAPVNALVAADGSGLSLLDRVTPRELTKLLGYAHAAPWGPAFHASLPVAGESELLRTRMRNTPAHGNLHAKTGTTDEVIGLAGYTTAVNGEVIAFTFIYNGTDRWQARSAIDAMGVTLSGFGRR